MPRNRAILVTVVGCAIVGLFANMSFGAMSDVKFFGKNIFDILDYLTSNIGMPLSTFGIAIAAAWVAWPATRKELATSQVAAASETWMYAARILIGVLAPVFVLVVALGGIFG